MVGAYLLADYEIAYVLDGRKRYERMYDCLSARDAVATFRRVHPDLAILGVWIIPADR